MTTKRGRRCKLCHKEHSRRWRAANPKHCKTYSEGWRDRNPGYYVKYHLNRVAAGKTSKPCSAWRRQSYTLRGLSKHPERSMFAGMVPLHTNYDEPHGLDPCTILMLKEESTQ